MSYGSVSSSEDMGAVVGILAQAFHRPKKLWEKWTGVIGEGALRAVRRDGAVSGCLGIHEMEQWFRGRAVPMGGIAAVGVPPELRGAGVAAELMTGALREMRERGMALSTLYASTQRLYRKVGYEQAGTICQYSVPASTLRPLRRDVEVRRADPADFESLRTLRREWGRRHDGFAARGRDRWRWTTDPWKTPAYAAVFGPEDTPEGYVLFIQHRGDPRGGYDLVLRGDLVALTPAAREGIWTYLADHRSLAANVIWEGPPSDENLLLLDEQTWSVREINRWMLRVTDVPAALAARGYPEDLEGSVALEVADETIPENAGRFRLRVAGGAGEVEADGDDPIALHVRDLAPLYTGFLSASRLAALGRLDGSADAIAAADRIFAGREPWMADRF